MNSEEVTSEDDSADEELSESESDDCESLRSP